MLESQKQLILRSESGQESTDAANSLPQNIRVMVSNHQSLQTIFAISETECNTQDLKRGEQFISNCDSCGYCKPLNLYYLIISGAYEPPR